MQRMFRFITAAAWRIATAWVLIAVPFAWAAQRLTGNGWHAPLVLLIAAVTGTILGLASARRRQRMVRFALISWAASRPRWRLAAQWSAITAAIAVPFEWIFDHWRIVLVVVLLVAVTGVIRAIGPAAWALARDLRWDERSTDPSAYMTGGVLFKHVDREAAGNRRWKLLRPERELNPYLGFGATVEELVTGLLEEAPSRGENRAAGKVSVEVAGAGATVRTPLAPRAAWLPEGVVLPKAPGTITAYDARRLPIARLRFVAIP